MSRDGLKLEIDLTHYMSDYDDEPIGDYFTGRITERAVEHVLADGAVGKAVNEAVHEAIDKRMDEVLDQLFTKKYRKTTCIGTPVDDKEFTIEELIIDRAGEYLTEQIDASTGKAPTQGHHGYSDRRTSRINWMISKIVTEVFDRSAKIKIEKAIQDARKEVNGKILEKISHEFKRVVLGN